MNNMNNMTHMRNNKLFVTMAVAAVLTMSCTMEDQFQVNERTANKVEFRQRTIPAGFQIGASLPASAEAVDLGLSVKWANMNLGAENVEQFGELYAWGEITPSHDYGWYKYEFNDFHKEDEKTLYITKYCFDHYGESQDLDRGGVNLDIYDDAAYMQWGEDWRMPTAAEIEELYEKCTWTYSTAKMTFTVTGPNGNSIDIPFEGVGIGKNISTETHPGVMGGLWSSTLSENQSSFAVELTLRGLAKDKFESGLNKTGANRCFGCYIRPVSAR